MPTRQVPRPHTAELETKLSALRRIASETEATNLVLRRQGSLSWLLGGRSNVPNTLDAACLDAIITPDELILVSNAIEAPRLQATEFAGIPAQWRVIPWWDDRASALPTEQTASDLPLPGMFDAAAQVADLRRVLTPAQRADLAELCADAAAATTRAALQLRPELTEYAAAGLLAGELLADAMDPIVLLVAGRERLASDRHPLPTTAPLGERAMLVCCARRHGLVASVTRIVNFGELSAAEHDRYRALLEVEADFLDASRPGTTLGDALATGTAGYARHGFAPDEWHRHHQGGFSGWEPREFPARPGSPQPLVEHQVLAWNPSADGWKVEDTCLVTADGVRPLVADEQWPSIEVRGRSRPDVLQV